MGATIDGGRMSPSRGSGTDRRPVLSRSQACRFPRAAGGPPALKAATGCRIWDNPARVGNRPYLRIHFRPSQARQRRQSLHQGQARAIAQATTEKHQQVYPKGRKTGAPPRTNSGRNRSQEGKAAGVRPPKKPVRGTQGVPTESGPRTEAEGQGTRPMPELQRARDPQPNALPQVR